MPGKDKNKKDKRYQSNGNQKGRNQNTNKKQDKPKPTKKPNVSKSSVAKLKHVFNSIFNMQMFKNLIFSPQYFWFGACIFLVVEAFINILIIENVKYTEIDWKAYMQEVGGFLNGTFDYTKLKGDTGSLVYPAGFVYFFSILFHLTKKGQNIYLAQYIFAVLYLGTLALIFRLFHKSKKIPPYVLLFICLTSYRIHSIYVLRLFNDPVAMFFLYLSLNFFISGYWSVGSVFFSIGVSIKMNILLFAPALLMAYLYTLGLLQTVLQLILCASIQILLGLPFLLTNAPGYLKQAFDLGRIFLFEWTVNWRFLPEEIFVNWKFHLALLICQIIVTFIVALTQWKRCLSNYGTLQTSKVDVGCQLLLLPMFMSNFIGIMFSRSLHYQFYVWYFHSIPYLLWSTNLSVKFRILILGLIELCWNTYPSTIWSSVLLHVCHLVVLVCVFLNRPTDEKVQSLKKKLQKSQ